MATTAATPSPPGALSELLQSELFSGVVAVIHYGRPLLEFAGGLANRQTGRVNDIETRFATASVSKLFTATCLARMTDAGLCAFEQPLIDLVPWLGSIFAPEMSLATLLCHRSGLGDYIDDDAELPFAGMDVARLDSTRAFLPYVLCATRGAPGRYFYSSAGFILLGLAIEEITGEPFSAAIARWVAEPAGLRSTGFPEMDIPAENMAVGYLRDGRPNFDHLPRFGGADGGIVTTAGDLRRLFDRLRHGDFLSDAARRFLWEEVSRINPSESYGHGFNLIHSGDRTWIGHTGSDPGISARVAFAQKPESSIVVLCNVDGIAFRVFRLVLDWLNSV